MNNKKSLWIIVGLTVSERTLQQYEGARFEIESKSDGENSPFQRTSGVGYVLNSMRTAWSPVKAG